MAAGGYVVEGPGNARLGTPCCEAYGAEAVAAGAAAAWACAPSPSPTADSRASDRHALRQLYLATGGAEWRHKKHWLEAAHPCDDPAWCAHPLSVGSPLAAPAHPAAAHPTDDDDDDDGRP